MVDVDQLVETLEIKTIYRITHSKQELWNILGKISMVVFQNGLNSNYDSVYVHLVAYIVLQKGI